MDEQMGALVVFWLVPRPDVGLEALVGQYLYVQVWVQVQGQAALASQAHMVPGPLFPPPLQILEGWQGALKS